MVLQRMIDRTLVEDRMVARSALGSPNFKPASSDLRGAFSCSLCKQKDCKMTFRYGERSYVEYNQLNNADRTCGTLLSHEPPTLNVVVRDWFLVISGDCDMGLAGKTPSYPHQPSRTCKGKEKSRNLAMRAVPRRPPRIFKRWGSSLPPGTCHMKLELH